MNYSKINETEQTRGKEMQSKFAGVLSKLLLSMAERSLRKPSMQESLHPSSGNLLLILYVC